MSVNTWTGKISWFGGSTDHGIGEQEGLGLIEPEDLKEWQFRRLFVTNMDPQYGLARNLDPAAFYLAMRFAYGSFNGVQGEILPGFSRDQVRRGIFKVTFNGKSEWATAADWGPNKDTGRLVDSSPGLLSSIGAETDNEVTVSFVELT